MHCTVRHFLHDGRPAKNFAGLMELYECIYIRLRNLLPDVDAVPERVISRVDGVLDLHLRVTERSRFTTTLNLTYLFHDRMGAFAAPDMLVRLYHDAQVGEVIACGRRRGQRHAEYHRMFHAYSLEQKWHMNRFLQKWLGYCLLQGHCFVPGRILQPEPEPDATLQATAIGLES